MASKASLVNTHFFYNKSQDFFRVAVERIGDEGDCSVSVGLSGGNLNPCGIQYNGIEQTLVWGHGETETKYAKFDILPSANKREYISVYLSNFLRCTPGKISQACIVLADKYYPTIFGGFVTLSAKKDMNREVESNNGIYTTRFTIPLPGDALLGDVRNLQGEFLQPTIRRIIKPNEWFGIVEIAGTEPIEDESLQIYIVLL